MLTDMFYLITCDVLVLLLASDRCTLRPCDRFTSRCFTRLSVVSEGIQAPRHLKTTVFQRI